MTSYNQLCEQLVGKLLTVIIVDGDIIINYDQWWMSADG